MTAPGNGARGNGGGEGLATAPERSRREAPSRIDELAREEARLLACVHCGFCLPACPTYTRLGDEGDSPRGRLVLMRAVAEGRLDPADPAFHLHIDCCLGCRACETVCPSGVEYGLLLERARMVGAAARRPSRLPRLLLAVFGRERSTTLVLALGRIFRDTGLPELAVRWLPSRGRLGQLRAAMAMLAASAPWPGFRKRGPERRPTGDAPGPGGVARLRTGDGEEEAVPPAEMRETRRHRPATFRHVGILEGCVQSGLYAHVNEATVRVLGVNGLAAHPVVGQGCCGALHAHGGDLDTARALARRNVEAFERAGVEWIVVNAAGCGAVMKEYGELLKEDTVFRQRAKAIAERVKDVSEALTEQGLLTGGPLELVVTYDAPCHLLHAQRVAEPPLELLHAVPGLELRPLRSASECCGGAGIYGLTHPDLGGRIGADKAAAVEETGAQVVATGNPGCMMQIGAALRLRGSAVAAAHPVELLDESYRRQGRYP